MWLCELCFVYFSIFLGFVTCFNVDSFNYATYTGPASSMFGFSLTLHKEDGRGWLIVGAPEDHSRYSAPDVYRGGAVYKCPVDRDESCEEIIFDRRDQRTEPPFDNRTEQWLGATVSASGAENGPIVACAPRYSWYPAIRHRDPVGTCWISNGHFNEFNEFSPCRTYKYGYHRQGSCQAGLSAALSLNGDRLFVGGPGSWYWQGQMYSIDAHARFKFRPDEFAHSFGATAQLIDDRGIGNSPVVFSTSEGSVHNNSYMGYSTITGNFRGNGEQSIAVGIPRGDGLKGQVVLFTWDLKDFNAFSGDQIGSYYGYALAASDVDGDGRDDLIVGAPMYTLPNSEQKYDVGRVYVIYQSSAGGVYERTFIIDGFNTRSRFGQALSTLGDINQDGFGDFAVGAPYDGSSERGAVYIYHGSSKGVREKYSQVISAEDVAIGSAGVPNTFGFSINGGIDLDGNEYPDMAVGAYSSNHAFVFRSRPVALVDARVQFRAPRKEIDIRTGDYKLRTGVSVSLTTIDFCFKYNGKGIPDSLDLNVQYILDSQQPKIPRMGFVENENTNVMNDTVPLQKNSPAKCVTKRVFVRTDIKDKLTPLEAEVKYFTQDDAGAHLYQTRDPRAHLRPALDVITSSAGKDSITILKDCGRDNICIPDLNVEVKSNVDQYTLGSQEDLKFDVTVSNQGEDSYETVLEVKHPKSVYYSRKESKLHPQVLCTTHENNTLRCELGNPIPRNKVVNFTIFWQPDINEGMAPSYEFDILVNSTNQERQSTFADNHAHVSVQVRSSYGLYLSGKSNPDKIYFNASQYAADNTVMYRPNLPPEKRLNEKEIGPQVTHVYYLKNDGLGTISETELYFVWPAYTVNRSDFVYLLEAPHFVPNRNVRCDSIVANRLRYEIGPYDKHYWERLMALESENNITTQGFTGGQHQTSTSGFQGENRQYATGGSQSGVTQHVSSSGQYGAGSGQHGAASGHYGTSSGQYGVSSGQHVASSGQYGSASGHYGTSSGQYGVSSGQHVASGGQYGVSSGQHVGSGGQYGSVSRQYGANSGQQQASSGQYGSASGHYGASSGQYGANSGQHVASGGQYGASSGQRGANTIGTVTYTIPGPTITKTSTKHYVTQDGVTRVQERNKTEVTNATGTFVTYDADRDLGHGTYRPGVSYSTGGYEHGLQNVGSRQYQNATHYQNTYGAQGQQNYYGGASSSQQGRTNYQHGGSAYQQSGSSHQQSGSAYQHGSASHQAGSRNFREDDYEGEGEEEEQSISGYYDKNGNYIARGQEEAARQTHTSLEAAAVGPGYGVTTLDLGKVGAERQPVHEVHYKQHVAELGGEGRGSAFSAREHSLSAESGRTGDSTGRRTEWQQETHWSQTQQVPPTYLNNIERDNVNTDRPANPQRFYGRKRRQVDPLNEIISKFPCQSVGCTYMKCTVGPIHKHETLAVGLRARINARVLENITTEQGTNFSSVMAARITKLPYVGRPLDQKLYVHEITTTVLPKERDLKPDAVPLWVVILSAVAGTIILLLLILLLYKLGFFKRNRPSRAPERQPLNRNGYHRDEAL